MNPMVKGRIILNVNTSFIVYFHAHEGGTHVQQDPPSQVDMSVTQDIGTQDLEHRISPTPLIRHICLTSIPGIDLFNNVLYYMSSTVTQHFKLFDIFVCSCFLTTEKSKSSILLCNDQSVERCFCHLLNIQKL